MISLVGGRYRVLRPLGAGGMGEVVVALHETLGKEVALKRLRPDVAKDPDARARMLREARALAALDHDNVVRVLDAGDDEGGGLYIAMELLQGRTLRRRIASAALDRKPIALPEALSIIAQIARGLEAAHAAGIVHRDLKPENVVLIELDRSADRGTPGAYLSIVRAKILDFGLAREAAGSDGVTTGNLLVGTPGYIAPERALKGELGAASDVYALGVVAFEVLDGAPPFDADTGLALVMKHASEAPPSIGARVPSLPLEVRTVVDACLAKDPGARPTAASVARTLEAVLMRSVGATEAMETPLPAPSARSLALAHAHAQAPDAVRDDHGTPAKAAGSTPETALSLSRAAETPREGMRTAPSPAGTRAILGRALAILAGGLLVLVGLRLAYLHYGVPQPPAQPAPAPSTPAVPAPSGRDGPNGPRAPVAPSTSGVLEPPRVRKGEPLPANTTLLRAEADGTWPASRFGDRPARPVVLVVVREDGKAALARVDEWRRLAAAHDDIDLVIVVASDTLKAAVSPELVARARAASLALHTAYAPTVGLDPDESAALVAAGADGVVTRVVREQVARPPNHAPTGGEPSPPGPRDPSQRKPLDQLEDVLVQLEKQ